MGGSFGLEIDSVTYWSNRPQRDYTSSAHAASKVFCHAARSTAWLSCMAIWNHHLNEAIIFVQTMVLDCFGDWAMTGTLQWMSGTLRHAHCIQTGVVDSAIKYFLEGFLFKILSSLLSPKVPWVFIFNHLNKKLLNLWGCYPRVPPPRPPPPGCPRHEGRDFLWFFFLGFMWKWGHKSVFSQGRIAPCPPPVPRSVSSHPV